MTDIPIVNKADEFLLAEFNALQSRSINLDNIRASRINFFLIATAAVGAGISTLFSSLADQSIVVPTFTFVSGVIWLLGFLTLKQSLEDSIAIVILLRRAGRIRLWFVKNNPAMKQYVAFEYSDDRPVMNVKYLVFRGGEAILLVLNLVAFSAFVTLLLSPRSWMQMILEILITAVFMWLVQTWYAHKKLRDAEKAVKGVRFRYEDSIKMVEKEEKTRVLQPKNKVGRKKAA